MAAHRYWRLNLTAPISGTAYSLSEIIMSLVAGGANQCTGGTAAASTVYASPTYTADKAFDGNGTTFWASAGSSSAEWISYDFGVGVTKDIVEFGFSARPDSFATTQTPLTGALQFSDDNAAWTNSLAFTASSSVVASQYQFFPTPTPTGKTYFDSTNKTSTISFITSNNLVANSSGAGAVAVSRTLSGLSYASAVITTLTGTPIIGLVNGAYSMSGAALLGTTADSLGYRSGGAVVVNGVTLATLAAFVQGDRIDMAIDPLNRLIWFRVNNGNWNNDVIANQNPVGAVGGIDYSVMIIGRLLVAVCASLSGTVWTGQFSTAFTNTPPTGFASIDNVGFTVARSSPAYEVTPVQAPSFSPAMRCGSMPVGDRTVKSFSPSGAITVVSGIVKENGVVVASRRVDVYDRNTGDLIGSTTSAADGTWSLPTVGRPTVRIVGSDPTTYNSIVYDNVAGV